MELPPLNTSRTVILTLNVGIVIIFRAGIVDLAGTVVLIAGILVLVAGIVVRAGISGLAGTVVLGGMG